MLRNATIGQAVELRYRAPLRPTTGLHGHRGEIVVAGRGRPRNHGVRLDDGRVVIVPAGHVRRVE